LGQNEKPALSASCQLPPAADVPPHEAFYSSTFLSERDIVRRMADGGSAALQLPVAQVMTRNVSTCDVNDSISSVMDRMTEGKFRHMPVFDKDRLAGLVSIGDVLKFNIGTLREHVCELERSLAEIKLMRL
jgi:signal-transduction protein with cAMP-binding, CBS, and nucleotidyltransferase domain